MRHLALLAFATIACATAPLDAVEWWTDAGARELTPASTRPAQAGEALTLLAPINGIASGQIALRAEAPIASAQAQCGLLVGASGTLPAGCVQVRWLTHARLAPGGGEAAPTAPFTTISDAFVPSASPLAVAYLTAAIPPGTAAGAYAGTVQVGAGDESATVPLTVQVADFCMPARSQLDLWIALMQSPAQLAFAYKVAPYGEEHWRAIAASTRLLGDLGHHVLSVPVLWHANCGSGPQMVTFVRDGDGLRPDFSRLERWFPLVARECGPPRLLVLGVWGRWLARASGKPLFLTEQTADGALRPLEWSSDYAAYEALWRQVHDGVAALAKRHLGLDPERIVLGFGDDLHPDEATDAVWRRIAPRSLGWEAWTHNYTTDRGPRPAYFQVVDTEAPKGVEALLAWPAATAPAMDAKGVQQPFYLSGVRDIQDGFSPAMLYYSIPDLATAPQKTGHCAGFARMGLDFWRKDIPLVDGTTASADGYASDGRDTRTHPGRVVRNYRAAFTAQGPTGALPLIHFDALREGVQAAQARLIVVQAMQAKPDQAADLRAVLDRQFQEGARHGVAGSGKRSAITGVAHGVIQSGWSALFAAAGRAQRDLGRRERDLAGAEAEIARRNGR